VVALVLSSALVNVAPPSATAIAVSRPAPLVTTGTDGNTLRVRLEVSSGSVGFNDFTVMLTDYTTGSPISDATVTLGFLVTGPETIGTSALRLTSLETAIIQRTVAISRSPATGTSRHRWRRRR
jgi:hypothetical protein